jgi:hypothetical protein
MGEMRRISWRTAEFCWNRSWVFSYGLVLCATGLAIWLWFFPQSPGVSIGLLAGVAGIMSVRPRMHSAEKFAWVVLLVAFTIFEVRAISISDSKNEANLNHQKAEFQAIAEGLKLSLTTSTNQYNSTITQVRGVLTTTQGVATVAQNNLAALTGGKSYAYITFKTFDVPPVSTVVIQGQTLPVTSRIDLRMTNAGDEPLTGITVQDYEEVGKEKYANYPSIQVGTLAPHASTRLSMGIYPHPVGGATVQVVLFITAQNGEVMEKAYFRQSTKKSNGLAYRYDVYRTHPDGKKSEKLRSMPWNDPE